MDYTSPACIFFVIAGLVAFFSFSLPLRYWVLLGLSFIWIYSWSPKWALLYFIWGQLNYWVIRLIPFSHLPVVILNLIIYLPLRTGTIVPRELYNPYGLSFFMLMLTGLVIDARRNEERAYPDWKLFTLMPVFFPALMAGPIQNGRHFNGEIKKSFPGFSICIPEGIIVFSLGFIRNYFLSVPAENFFREFLKIPSSPLVYFLIGVLATLITYLKLSSFALMGRGFARCFGINLELSFRPIYFANCPKEFWSRWNITLGRWIRDYFTLPLLLKFGRRFPPSTLGVLAFMLVGLWHGIAWHWIIFGLFNGIMVVSYSKLDNIFRSKIVGYVFAWFVIAGNGLILTDPGYNPLTPSWSLSNFFSSTFGAHFSSLAIFILGLVILIECIEEIKGDQEWYLKGPLGLNYLMSALLLLTYYWAIQADVIQFQTTVNLPLYFKM
jgi:D-alanyl-lipoteichoic acid acyltransferase DltB (MBOAT superfamily)